MIIVNIFSSPLPLILQPFLREPILSPFLPSFLPSSFFCFAFCYRFFLFFFFFFLFHERDENDSANDFRLYRYSEREGRKWRGKGGFQVSNFPPNFLDESAISEGDRSGAVGFNQINKSRKQNLDDRRIGRLAGRGWYEGGLVNRRN